MPIQYVFAELFTPTEENPVKAYAYDCNCEGVMNSQVAVAFRNRYPLLDQEYRRMCLADPPELTLGDSFMWQSREGIWIFSLAVYENMFCKVAPKRTIEKAFRTLREQMEAENIEDIAMPTVGGGIGALYWGKARHSLERAFHKWKGSIYVYVKPVNSRSNNSTLL